MKIDLDVSCLNRAFDDQGQPRIRLESEAVTIIIETVDSGRWAQVSSRMVEIEVLAIPDETRRRRVLQLLPDDILSLTAQVFARSRKLVDAGLAAADAVHVAAAEALNADVFLKCDDRLLRRCARIAGELRVRVVNPLQWPAEQNDAPNPG